MPQLRRCLRLLCLCALTSLLVLVARQTKLGGVSVGYSGSLADYLGGLRFSASALDNGSAATVAVAAASHADSLSWRSGYGTNGSFRINYPRLYASLRLLTGGAPTVVNWTAPPPAGVKACQRPKSQSLVAELTPPTPQAQPPPEAPAIEAGGFWSPRDCWPPVSRTAVIVPYRNRSENLDTFVPYMWNLLRRQGLAFALFVVEQANTALFNRAKLLNVGFKVAQQFRQLDCFVFQDADKVPENAANVYDCANSPKLLISEMRSADDPTKKYRQGRLYSNFFGGAVAVSKEAFMKVNGNSNRYYGWGREDDELAARLGIAGYQIRYNSGPDSRFVNLRHSHDIITNTMPWPYVHKVRQTMNSDGLNSLNYTDRGIYLHPMFVLIRVDL